jgi:hypothetical protein
VRFMSQLCCPEVSSGPCSVEWKRCLQSCGYCGMRNEAAQYRSATDLQTSQVFVSLIYTVDFRASIRFPMSVARSLFMTRTTPDQFSEASSMAPSPHPPHSRTPFFEPPKVLPALTSNSSTVLRIALLYCGEEFDDPGKDRIPSH